MDANTQDDYRPALGRFGHAALLLAASVLVPLFYRLRVRRADLPEGPAVFAPNHVTYVDSLLVAVAMRRPMRFVMTARFYNTWFIRPFLRIAGAIPIRPRSEDPQCLERAYAAIEAALDAGEQVCIFPEGRLTPSGEIEELRNGVLRIVARKKVPVVPVGLGGLWGSRWSQQGTRWSWRRRTVDVRSGDAIAPSALGNRLLHARISALRSAA